MSHPDPATAPTASSDLPRSRGIRSIYPSGSVLASFGTIALVASLPFLPSCLVTETRDIPPRNQPPLILSPDVNGSVTTPNDAVFLVSSNPDPQLNQRIEVALSIDVTDSDDDFLEYRVFVIGPQSTSGFDAGVADAGASAPSGFERRMYGGNTFSLAPQVDRVGNRGRVSTIRVPNYEFLPSGRCYAVEVRVSSAFRGAADDPYATDQHLPVRDGDISSVLYWVASYGLGDTSVDLASCPVHTQ